jgi:hypothetical protein
MLILIFRRAVWPRTPQAPASGVKVQ